jgi:hypothetical protein
MRAQKRMHKLQKSLIGQSDSLCILQQIFSDAFLLDHDFAIQSIGKSVTSDFGFSLQELKGKSIDSIIPDFTRHTQSLLQDGFFCQKKYSLKSKLHNSVFVNLSGFYTGLLTDIDGFIILLYENIGAIDSVQKQLIAKAEEMDHFIYQASHSLRGPLATIRGLINIAQIEHDPLKLKFIHGQLNEFANKLDTKLYKLMCFAEADKEVGIPMGVVNAIVLEQKLIEARSQIIQEPPNIKCEVLDMDGKNVNEHLIESLLVNLTGFLLSVPRQSTSSIYVCVSGKDAFVKMVIDTIGLDFDSSFQKTLLDHHGYGHLLEQPELTSAYAAQKVIFKLQGKIDFAVMTPHRNKITISIPYNFISIKK